MLKMVPSLPPLVISIMSSNDRKMQRTIPYVSAFIICARYTPLLTVIIDYNSYAAFPLGSGDDLETLEGYGGQQRFVVPN